MSSDKTILVTGSGGQLGNELKVLSPSFPEYHFIFASHDELRIGDIESVKKMFEAQQIDYCINCAAYTAVDRAEAEKENAFFVNADAVGNLAKICNAHQALLVHISTDYVFDGTSQEKYSEESGISPVNTYGASKLRGEELALNNAPSSIVIRTSWLYSSFGNNFVKTMLRLMKEKESINVVDDQTGSPTYAADLAEVIMKLIDDSEDKKISGILNYANTGETTWYDFACEIKKITKSKCIVNPVPTASYPTPAKRPKYSVLDTTRIRKLLGIKIPTWKTSLKKCLAILTTDH